MRVGDSDRQRVGRVRLHPSVADSAAAQDLVSRGLDVVGDASLQPADALVESTGGAVVARWALAVVSFPLF